MTCAKYFLGRELNLTLMRGLDLNWKVIDLNK